VLTVLGTAVAGYRWRKRRQQEEAARAYWYTSLEEAEGSGGARL
jgi:hypothetical protein